MARGQYLLILDDDSRLASKDTLKKLLEVIENDKTIGMSGGLNVILADASSFIKRTMREIPRRASPPVNEVIESDLAEHGLLIIRKDVFIKVGGENELIPRGLDPYLRLKFRQEGYKVVVVPGAYYSHLPPHTFIKLVKQFFRNGKQAAYCNKFYPQWVIETPGSHVKDFVERRPFSYRAGRYTLNMIKNTLRGRWIYISAYIAYAIGFVWVYFIKK